MTLRRSAVFLTEIPALAVIVNRFVSTDFILTIIVKVGRVAREK